MAYRIFVNFAIGINRLNIVYPSQTLMDVGHTDLKYAQHHSLMNTKLILKVSYIYCFQLKVSIKRRYRAGMEVKSIVFLLILRSCSLGLTLTL